MIFTDCQIVGKRRVKKRIDIVKDLSREELESGRPSEDPLYCVTFCLEELYKDKTKSTDDRVAGDLIFEELIGTLLLAKDCLEEEFGVGCEHDDNKKNRQAAPRNRKEAYIGMAHEYLIKKPTVYVGGHYWRYDAEQGIYSPFNENKIRINIGNMFNRTYCQIGSDYSAIARRVRTLATDEDFFKKAPFGIPCKSFFLGIHPDGSTVEQSYSADTRQRLRFSVDPTPDKLPEESLLSRYFSKIFQDDEEQKELVQRAMVAAITCKGQKNLVLTGDLDASIVEELLEKIGVPFHDDHKNIADLALCIYRHFYRLCDHRLPKMRKRESDYFETWRILEFPEIEGYESQFSVESGLADRILNEEPEVLLNWIIEGAKKHIAAGFRLPKTSNHKRIMSCWQR